MSNAFIRALGAVLEWPWRRRQRPLLAARANYTKDLFSRHFRDLGVPQALIDDVWAALVDAAVVEGFKPHPDDNLGTVYGLAEEDLDEDIILTLLQKHRCHIPTLEEMEKIGAIETVADLVNFLAKMHPLSRESQPR